MCITASGPRLRRQEGLPAIETCTLEPLQTDVMVRPHPDRPASTGLRTFPGEIGVALVLSTTHGIHKSSYTPFPFLQFLSLPAIRIYCVYCTRSTPPMSLRSSTYSNRRLLREESLHLEGGMPDSGTNTPGVGTLFGRWFKLRDPLMWKPVTNTRQATTRFLCGAWKSSCPSCRAESP